MVLGFSAGAVLGVALFDLLPEALVLGVPRFGAPAITAAVGVGFLAYMLLDRAMTLHSHAAVAANAPRGRGALGAGSLCIHSLIDGVSIGLAFKVSAGVGIVVATAVLIHDFSDGINTVGLILRGRGSDRSALRWLLADAIAPVAGAAATLAVTPDPASLGLVLAGFAGFFLYIGASDLLPESYHRHPQVWTTALTLLGALTMYVGVRLAMGCCQ